MRAQKLSESEIVFKPKLTDKRFIDLEGMTFDRLVVLGFAGRSPANSGARAMWFCRCECGSFVKVFGNALRAGQCTSCGCRASETSAKRLLVHGDNRIDKKHYLYILRNGIVARCCNPRCEQYKWYGGRGITLFEEWKNSYVAFRDYILANLGERPNDHQLDRIDNERGYEPGNLRWASPSDNCLNKRTTKFLTINGVKKNMVEWSKSPGAASYDAIGSRVRAGWSPEEAVFGKHRNKSAVPNVAASE